MSDLVLISGLVSIFAVIILGLAAFVSSGGGSGGLQSDQAVFKTGNPSLEGLSSTQAQPTPSIEPAVIHMETERVGGAVESRPNTGKTEPQIAALHLRRPSGPARLLSGGR